MQWWLGCNIVASIRRQKVCQGGSRQQQQDHMMPCCRWRSFHLLCHSGPACGLYQVHLQPTGQAQALK